MIIFSAHAAILTSHSTGTPKEVRRLLYGLRDAVDAALMQVAVHPTRFASPDGLHRECPVKKFPFRIVYRLVENRVMVVAIAHAKRRPGYWHDRT